MTFRTTAQPVYPAILNSITIRSWIRTTRQHRDPYYLHSSEHLGLPLKTEESFFVVAWDNLTFGDPLQVFEALSASEPGWVVPGQPALGDAISPLIAAISFN